VECESAAVSGDAADVCFDFLLVMTDKLERARQAAGGGAWQAAAELLLEEGDARPTVSPVVGGWQCEVAIWGGDQRVAGDVRQDAATTEYDAYREVYRYLEPGWKLVLQRAAKRRGGPRAAQEGARAH
jgi:hypothetical protein